MTLEEEIEEIVALNEDFECDLVEMLSTDMTYEYA